MQLKIIALAAALGLGATGAALAQTTPAAPGRDPAASPSGGLDRTPGATTGSTVSPPGREGGMGNMGGGTGSSANTGVGLGKAGANQGPRQ